MLNWFDVLEYDELIKSLRELDLVENENGLFQDLVDQIEKALNDFSNLKYALDKSIIVAITNVSGQVLYVNDKFCEISKYSRNELVGKTHRIINSKFHDKQFFKNMWETIKSGEIWEGNIKNRAKDGSYYWVKTTIVPFCNENKKPYMFMALRTDITKSKENEERLITALRNDFKLVVSSMHNFVFRVSKNNNGKAIYLLGEGKLAYKLGLETMYIYHKTPHDIFPNEIANLLEQNYTRAFKGEAVTYTYFYEGRYLLSTLSPVYENGEIASVMGCSSDITDLQKAQEEVNFLAFHDTLTNLPNRRKFNEDIAAFINNKQKFALFFLDLDQFKQVNDSFGHALGDELLKKISLRLVEAMGMEGTIYRLAGDEFIVIYPINDEEICLNLLANKALSIFKKKMQLQQRVEIFITGSIGISIFPDHGEDVDTLLKKADSAMYAAKGQKKNSYKIFDNEMNQAYQTSMQIEHYLRQAIENEELELYFQPKLSLETNHVTSMEALLRWNNPVLGNIPPSTFIPIAEECGLIFLLDEWVLRKACEQNKKWNESEKWTNIRLAVNISPNHFSHPDFVVLVEKILKEIELKPELLELEITENILIENTEDCSKNIKRLRNIGVIVSVDDFGTGYSSINYLKRFPFHWLKIDRSYVKEMMKNNKDIAIVNAIITLAHEMDLKVVAEGVEDKSTLECLKQLGCDEIQGYYFCHPLPSGEIEKVFHDTEAYNSTVLGGKLP